MPAAWVGAAAGVIGTISSMNSADAQQQAQSQAAADARNASQQQLDFAKQQYYDNQPYTQAMQQAAVQSAGLDNQVAAAAGRALADRVGPEPVDRRPRRTGRGAQLARRAVPHACTAGRDAAASADALAERLQDRPRPIDAGCALGCRSGALPATAESAAKPRPAHDGADRRRR
jgi:hypothetical protein